MCLSLTSYFLPLNGFGTSKRKERISFFLKSQVPFPSIHKQEKGTLSFCVSNLKFRCPPSIYREKTLSFSVSNLKFHFLPSLNMGETLSFLPMTSFHLTIPYIKFSSGVNLLKKQMQLQGEVQTIEILEFAPLNVLIAIATLSMENKLKAQPTGQP